VNAVIQKSPAELCETPFRSKGTIRFPQAGQTHLDEKAILENPSMNNALRFQNKNDGGLWGTL
jgi:hypothetical protein